VFVTPLLYGLLLLRAQEKLIASFTRCEAVRRAVYENRMHIIAGISGLNDSGCEESYHEE
jgi:hypothetical protein